MHNPFAGFPRSQGWHNNHQAVDYATPVGTVFGAPTGGTYHRLADRLSRTDPSAPGRWGELVLGDGRAIRFCHLDHHLAAHGARVAEGDPLAATGNTGYVLPSPTRAQPNAGAHMHTYGLTAAGARWNWTTDAGATLARLKDDDDMTPDQMIATLTNHRPFPKGRNLFDQLVFIADMTALAVNKPTGGGGGGAGASAAEVADELAKRLGK